MGTGLNEQIRPNGPDDVTARLDKSIDLRERGIGIGGGSARHRLDGNGRSPANLHPANINGTREVTCGNGRLRHGKPPSLKQAQDIDPEHVYKQQSEQNDTQPGKSSLDLDGHLPARHRLDDFNQQLAAV